MAMASSRIPAWTIHAIPEWIGIMHFRSELKLGQLVTVTCACHPVFMISVGLLTATGQGEVRVDLKNHCGVGKATKMHVTGESTGDRLHGKSYWLG